MSVFETYLQSILNPVHREKMRELLLWVKVTFPKLEERIAWNQPMFVDHSTFIVGFSCSKKHVSLAPEAVAIQFFQEELKRKNVDFTKEIIRFPWQDCWDLNLIKRIIQFNIDDKRNCHTFWRK